MLQVTENLTPARTSGSRRSVLLVDDDRSSLFFLQSQFTELGYETETAGNGAEAFAMMREDPRRADVIVTDCMMPVLDGLGLTRRLKREAATAHIPIVILTGATSQDDISAGIQAGAFYYLTKPPSPDLITSVMESAFKEVQRNAQVKNTVAEHQSAFRNLEVARFKLRMPEEVDAVVSMMASMHERPDRAIQGIHELVENAVEHGVLRFGLETKAHLLQEGTWEDALKTRSRDPRYAEGVVEATAARRNDGLVVNVKDNGPGFAWRPFMTSDPARAHASCGRGIARAANFSFDKLIYNEAGNQAIGYIAGEPKVVW